MSPLPTSIFFHISLHLLPLPAIQFAQSNIPATNRPSFPPVSAQSRPRVAIAPGMNAHQNIFKGRFRPPAKGKEKSLCEPPFFFYLHRRKKRGDAYCAASLSLLHVPLYEQFPVVSTYGICYSEILYPEILFPFDMMDMDLAFVVVGLTAT